MIKYETKHKHKGKNTKELLILHHTGNTGLNGNIRTLRGEIGGVSCHYLVDLAGQVYSFGTEADILRHCGASYYDGRGDLNRFSIGIEVLGPGFTNKQRQAVDNLILDIVKRNNIKIENVLRHKDITSRKVDIDDSFWNNRFKSFIDYKRFLINKDILMGFYEKIFKEECGKSAVFNDLDGALNRCIDDKGSIVAKEFFYLVMIGLERILKAKK